jgi:hypothetical protein
VVGAGQILVVAATVTSSGFSVLAIYQSTSSTLVLLLFVLGPFSIQSGTSLKRLSLQMLGGGGGCRGIAGVGSGG